MTFRERYKYNPVTDLLGKGGFARVYMAYDINLDIKVAVKIFNATEANNGKYTVYEEIKRGVKLNHPNILRYYDAAILENTNSLGEMEVMQIGIMELASAGDLKKFAQLNPNSPVLLRLLKEVLSGLDYLHLRGLIHRDLKPQNILLSDQDGSLVAKISDFGISKAIDGSGISSSKAIGTIEYMAPEQFNVLKYGINGEIGTNLDLWSFGVMVYELITGESLFGQRGGNTSAEQIMSSILLPAIPDKVEQLLEPYRSVVKRCLIHKAKDRVQRGIELIQILEGKIENDDILVRDYTEENNQTTRVFQIPKEAKMEFIPNPITPDEKISTSYSKQTSINFIKSRKLKLGLLIFIALIIIAAIRDLYIEKSKETIENAQTYYREGDTTQAIYILKREIPSINIYDSVKVLNANSFLGKILLETSDTAEAISYLEQAALMGDVNSIFEIGWISYQGRYQKQNLTKAITYFKNAASKGNAKADLQLGNMYFEGVGVDIDYNEALKYYKSAAYLGSSIAMYMLGTIYKEGIGVLQDFDQAKSWYIKSIELNDNTDVVTSAKSQIDLIDQ